MKFNLYPPCERLKPYVKFFAIQEKEQASIYKVLPDRGLVMGFQYRGKLILAHDGQEMALSRWGISGLADSYRVFKNSPHIGTLLVYFKEAGATPFLRLPLHELFGQSLSLDNFIPASQLLLLEEQLCEASSDRERIHVVEEFLLARMIPTPPDTLVVAALSLINQNRGAIRIKDLSRQLYISQSPLEKRFRKILGTSPKKFTSIIRLQNAIKHYSPESSLTALAYKAGFYDQAHFIKEFKTFTGQTPENYFASQH